MQRYEISIQQPWNTHATEHGEWVKFTDAQATITRLTAERDEARAEAAAAYERAAQVCDDVHIILGDGPRCVIGEYQEDVQPLIRALATEPGTTALAEMLDAETRACAATVAKLRDKDNQIDEAIARYAIIARIGQRKEAGE